MNQENTAYGADSGYHMPIPGMMGGGDTDYGDGPYHLDEPGQTRARDTFVRQEQEHQLSPEQQVLDRAALEVDQDPISEAVHTRVIGVAGVEMGA